MYGSPQSPFLILESDGDSYAIPIHEAREITPMATLMTVPGASKLLAGFLNLHGAAVPVVRMGAADSEAGRQSGLDARIIVLLDKGQALGLLVDAVVEIVDATEESLKEYNAGYVFNDCVSGTIQVAGRSIPVLSTAHLLLATERRRIADFQAIAQSRIHGLDIGGLNHLP